jgi:hypothetical protein
MLIYPLEKENESKKILQLRRHDGRKTSRKYRNQQEKYSDSLDIIRRKIDADKSK